MTFVRYQPKTRVGGCFSEYARLSRESLRFSKEAWEGMLGKAQRVALYYEEATRTIGLRACPDGDREPAGLKVEFSRGRVPVIRWRGFLRVFCLDFERPVTVRMERLGSEKGETIPVNGMVVLKLSR